MPELLLSIPLAKLKPSPTNPRKHFDDARTAELADSITKVGVLEPIIVRQWKRTDGYEIVCGERRYRAAKLAKVEGVPAVVREYSDDDVLEIQITENSQRENPHPLDEADGFKVLVDRGRTPASIADKIGRPTKYVLERLQLCNLSPKCRKALDEDAITIGVAMVLARIPQAKVQDEALQQCEARDEEACVSVARASELVRDDFMLKLEDAPFDRADPDLLPKAGACTTCPKRTGNQTELFDDVKSPDLCIDGACYREKGTAYMKAVVAGEKGKRKLKVLSEAEAKKTFNAYNGGIGYSSNYEDLKGEQSFYSGTGPSKRVKNKVLVGPDAEVTLGQDPKTGKVYELISKKLVKAALERHKKTATAESRKKKTAKTKAKVDPKEAAKRKADAEKAKAKEQINEALVERLVAVAEAAAPLPGVHATALRLLVQLVMEIESEEKLCARRQIGPEASKKPAKRWAANQKRSKALDALVSKAGPDWLWGVVVELLAWNAIDRDYGPKTGNVDPLLKAYGVDRKRVEADTLKALKSAKEAAAAEPQAPKKKAAAKKATAKKKGRRS